MRLMIDDPAFTDIRRLTTLPSGIALAVDSLHKGLYHLVQVIVKEEEDVDALLHQIPNDLQERFSFWRAK